MAALVLLLFGLVPTVAAAPPVREDVPLEPLVLEGICPFDVLIEPLTNRETLTTFFDQAGNPRLSLVTGALKVRLTNLSTGKTVDLNIPGPGRFIPQPNGALTQITEGPWLIFFPPDTFPGTPDPQLLFIRGRTVTQFDPEGNPTLISLKGHVEDICAALADP
jgi:hypothetical protein